MKNLIIPLLLFLSLIRTGWAETLKIENIDKGKKSSEPTLLYLSDGRIGVLNDMKGSDLNIAEEAMRKDIAVDIQLDKKHLIQSIKLSSDKIKLSNESDTDYFKNDYQPTILPDLASVDAIFKRMNRGWQKKSQCYNRAHVWNYEEFNKTGLMSKKVFIFYTRRYIRNYNFYWWFHAIPTVLVNNEGTTVERFLDPMFAKRPLEKKQWTDLFIKSRRACPVITKYSDYSNYQEQEDCYLHFSSMYYWQPRDLDKFERTGFEKKSFIRSEINHAYWEAF